MRDTAPRATVRGLVRVAGLAGLALALAGCSSLRPTQKAFAPDEYHLRHPIRIADAPRHLDVFATGAVLDRRQRRDIAEFAAEYRARGRGPMLAALPSGGAGARLLPAIRAALREGGAGALHVTGYPADPRLGAAPVRLSFMTLQAQVASECGLWPADLAGTEEAESWHNRPYHNLGCAYQSMIAAQVADPLDLVRPRAESPIDPLKRTKDIEALRKDQDPSTNWRRDDVKIKEAGQ
ncbi:CpaD family pilus assembly protein [Rhabdaerophilum calidifontis]|uniref:CpaD family pilus assembly protein n=1 Tax=Rhabdaerophilum calidifontis TaxID=2604328 RepID=UPI00140CF6CF|nr:CpaD family pilus assembly protein [Rhabdaerophilum calidifontis]